ncbi:MAG: class I SAM-dependent methyltransferase [Bacteriovoracaceae bacterium]
MSKLQKQSSWKDYYKKVRSRPAHPLLKIALEKSQGVGKAYDLGSGAGVDTLYLANLGWKVTAIDKEPSALEFLKETKTEKGKIKTQNKPFEKIKLKKSDLILSINSLPFCHPKKFKKLWKEIRHSLKPEGILIGTLFGNNDTWAQKFSDDMSFFDHKGFSKLIGSKFDILYFDEREDDRPTALGHMKHWHIYHFILKRC